ncbi:hypothetical protein [Bradyrhizobium sp.]|uniref:hypothetical protein n=1 Tax=Bradyrhizobium sp. TaxID=376 RepID=UPI001DC57B85|nr:hypothetical protein [Bradyrhizobium sp.]MBV8700680.1 hypothetical protein [Bradyrhizobium sp.]MBV8920015.1 hypothetical protein [Bradyrhizobium sp.]MBV9980769.1 hypothetical protein [Bradyrhizobium sp.]
MSDPLYPDDPYRSHAGDADTRRAREFDNRLQVDPELEERRAGGGRLALYALAVAILLAAVFYGLNRSGMENAGTAPPTQTSQTQPATPGDAPRPNAAPGTTTGATNRPAQSENAGSESSRAAKPADNNGAPAPQQNNDHR